MSKRKCMRCGKESQTGNKRSHSNVATKRQFRANIQTKKIDGKSVCLCTACIRTQAKQSA